MKTASGITNEKMLKDELIAVLNSQKIAYNSVKVFRDDNLYAVLGIKWDDENNFSLAYIEFVNDLKPEEVKSLLKHEICHFLSIRTTKIRTIRVAEEYVKYAMIFREFLAHKEFRKRFGIDEGLASFHRGNLKHYDVLVKQARLIRQISRVEDYQRLLYFFLSILYDAIYFYVMKDDWFRRWCQRRNLSALHRVYEWIYEDMAYFSGLTLGQEQKEKLVQKAAIFPISLNLVSILQNNRIDVIEELFKQGTDFDEMLNSEPEMQHIAEKWIQRLTMLSSINDSPY